MERPVLGSSQRDGTSAADAMVEKIQFQKILKNLQLFVKNEIKFLYDWQQLPAQCEVEVGGDYYYIGPQRAGLPPNLKVRSGKNSLRCAFSEVTAGESNSSI